MKWIGQHIWDFISRFRTTVYLENLETSSDENVLVVDSDGKVTKNTTLGGADLTYNGSTANGVLTYGSASTIDVESDIYFNSSDLTILDSGTGGGPTITLSNSNADAFGPSLKLVKTQNGADNDILGKLTWTAKDDGGGVHDFATIIASIADATAGQEAGKLEFAVAEYDGSISTIGLKLDGDTDADGEIDVTIGAGAASMTTIVGDLDIDGDNMTSAGAMTFTPVGKYTIVAPDISGAVFHLDANTDTDNIVDIDAGRLDIDCSENVSIEATGTAELAGSTVTLDSAGAITFERGSSAVEVPDVAGTLQVVDLVKYLLPSDFIVNDAAFVRGYMYAADDAGSNYGGTWQDAGLQSWAWYQIPKGFKITHMYARGNVTSSTDCSIFQLDPTDGTRGSALASGIWGTNRSLSTAITSADDAVALVVVDNNANTDIIYSVKLTLALV